MKKKVLFIEDDPIDQLAIRRVMKKCNSAYDFEIISSVVEAKKNLQASEYDIVFIDFALRDGTGFDVFDFIDPAPFVLMTGKGREEIAVEAMKCGAADYLVKETNHQHLKRLPELIEYTMDKHHSKQKLNDSNRLKLEDKTND